MIRDITIGQYYQTQSVIHRMDPRLKIIATLVYIAALFVVDHFIGFLFCWLVLETVITLSKVPRKFILRGLKPVFLIIAFTLLVNLFTTQGHVIFSLWRFQITREGAEMAAFMGIRLVLLILGSSMLTLTTRPIGLTDGIEALLSPFKRFGLPAHDLAMMMTIALRFIPTLLEETDKIMKAQQARGADFESGNILHRAKALIPILVPLFISAFRIAQDLAMAMEARCYGSGITRTRMNEMRFSGGDIAGAVLTAAFLAAVIVLRILF